MTREFIGISIVILIAVSCYGQNKIHFTPTFTESKETTHKIPEGQEYTFGYLEVLENRDNPNGNRIKLPIYIFKSRSENPKPDPILYTVGGPGYTSMRASKYMEYYKYLDDRDFILFEQRGTQFAKPSLDCPEWAQAIYESNLPNFDITKTDSLFQKAAKARSVFGFLKNRIQIGLVFLQSHGFEKNIQNMWLIFSTFSTCFEKIEFFEIKMEFKLYQFL